MNATRLSINVSVLPLLIVVISHSHCSFLHIKKKYPKLESIKFSYKHYICEISVSIKIKSMYGHHSLINCEQAY